MIVQLLVLLLVCGLVYWVAHRIIAAFGLPAPVAVLADVVLVVVFVVALLNLTGLGVSWPLR